MTSTVLLAVDAGTTRMKAALMDLTGRVLALESCDVPVQHPFEGASEIDMGCLWDGFCRLAQGLKASHPVAWADLAGACISGQGDGCWPVDAAGDPVRPAMLWNDTRTREIALENTAEVEAYCIENALTPLFPGAAPLLMRWLKAKEPENYARVRWALHCKDWLNLRLTGRAATDPSDASTALLNVRTLEYDAELLNLLGIPESEGRFPPLVASGQVMGQVTKAAAALSGLPEGLPVVMGGIDVAVAAAGAGVTEPGESMTIVGTTLCNEVVIGPAQVDHRDTRGSALRHVAAGSFLRVMATSGGTSAIDWARMMFAPEMTFAEIEAGIAEVPPGCRGVLFHPYLYGERSPFRNAFACGGFYGLSARHTAMDLMRAVYEGIGMMLLDCYQALPEVRQVVVTGGGTSSDTLCQILSDCLGKPVIRTGIAELGLHGAYRLMCQGLGLTASEPVETIGYARRFEPDAGRQRLYRSLYGLFSNLRSSMESFWDARNQVFGPTGE